MRYGSKWGQLRGVDKGRKEVVSVPQNDPLMITKAQGEYKTSIVYYWCKRLVFFSMCIVPAGVEPHHEHAVVVLQAYRPGEGGRVRG